MEKTLLSSARSIASDFLSFVNSAVTPFHVVDYSRQKLQSKGFLELHENQNWELAVGGKYFLTRNNSSIVAFTVGSKFNTSTAGFNIIGAHTDSPCLRLAPISKASSQGFQQLCVTTYGGGLWHTWFDRELSIAGKLIVKNAKTQAYESKLFHIKRPLIKIPNLAIHLVPAENRGKFEFNKESHLRPIISSEIYEKLLKGADPEKKAEEVSILKKHYEGLVKLIVKEGQVDENDTIVDLDGYLFDANPSIFFGLNEEFISSARIDNLFSSFTALNAIIESGESFHKENGFINLISLFDHEECGSVSFQGADSNFLMENLKRVFTLLAGKESKADDFEKAMQKSFLISADMAHSIHPNYSEKHQQNHQVKLNAGIVIKTNNDQRYATDVVSASIVRIIAEKNDVPIQDFVVRNDSPCGSTIGPMISAKTGIKTVDIGAPQLSMHSVRETAGVLDALYYDRLFKGFFKDYEKINHSLLDI